MHIQRAFKWFYLNQSLLGADDEAESVVFSLDVSVDDYHLNIVHLSR